MGTRETHRRTGFALVLVAVVTAAGVVPAHPGVDVNAAKTSARSAETTPDNAAETLPTNANANAGPAAAPTRALAPPKTLDDLFNRARAWQVALRVERTEDARAPIDRRLQRFWDQREKEYFKRPQGYVSGLLVDDGKHILTTYYNVSGRVTAIKVTFPTGLSFPARIVAHSQLDDLALLQYDTAEAEPPAPPPPLEWATGGSLRPGQIVFVGGRSPEPRDLTVTRGIVSAVKRNGGRMIQTDAELNYGNVGGVILNLDGKIVGLAGFVGHTRPQWGLNSGIGFGTKADTIRAILPKLLAGENIEPAPPPFLGVGPGEAPFNPRGFEVGLVQEGSAADKAGIRVGDTITEFNGKPVANFEQLRNVIFFRHKGEAVSIKLLRDGDAIELEVELGEREE